MSSDQFGMKEYAKNKFGENSDYAKRTYEQGDMNTTMIKTEKGKTIMIQHDMKGQKGLDIEEQKLIKDIVLGLLEITSKE